MAIATAENVSNYQEMLGEQRIDQAILSILSVHRGHEQRISREQLLRCLAEWFRIELRDRHMRSHIEDLRRNSQAGAWICSSLDGGYFMATSLDELQTYLDSEESRLAHIARKIRRQRSVAGLPLSGQMALGEE